MCLAAEATTHQLKSLKYTDETVADIEACSVFSHDHKSLRNCKFCGQSRSRLKERTLSTMEQSVQDKQKGESFRCQVHDEEDKEEAPLGTRAI